EAAGLVRAVPRAPGGEQGDVERRPARQRSERPEIEREGQAVPGAAEGARAERRGHWNVSKVRGAGPGGRLDQAGELQREPAEEARRPRRAAREVEGERRGVERKGFLRRLGRVEG